MDKKLLAITLLLVVFGLVVLSSAGIVDAQKKFGSPYYYLTHQLLFGILPGLAIFFLLSRIDFRFWKKLALPVLFASLLLLVMVFIPRFGLVLKGATRWVQIVGVSFQPSEILKFSLILYFAAWFSGRNDRTKNWAYGIAPFFIVFFFVAALLMLQPDIGTLVIVALITLGMYFFAGVEIKYLVITLGILAILFAGVIVIEPYRFNRIKTFLNPSLDPQGISYQLNQSLISIGSGGLWGVGYGHSTQKLGFLPEVVNDSIFAVIAEELGFVGSVATIALFVFLSITLLSIARETADTFGRLFVMGVNLWVTSQAFLNIAAVSGLAPLTGIPLPFISYGGTSAIALLAGLGIALNVAKHAQ